MGKKKGCNLCKDGCEVCPLYRKGIRLTGLEQREEKYENCVFHIIADNLEEVHRKVYSIQKEVGETKNAAILHTMSALVDSPEAKMEIKKMLNKYFSEVKKLS